jgi:hypothetical protein
VQSAGFGEGRISRVYPERRVAVVGHTNGRCCVVSWLHETSPNVGDRILGDMSKGGWTRLFNATAGVELRVFRHLYCCDEPDVLAFTAAF